MGRSHGMNASRKGGPQLRGEDVGGGTGNDQGRTGEGGLGTEDHGENELTD